MTGAQVVRQGREETGLARFRKSHAGSVPVAAAGLAVAALMMGSGNGAAAVAATILGASLAALAWRWVDPLAAIPLRWATVAHDVGLVAAGSGVPNVRRVWAGPAGPTFVVGCGGVPAGAVEDAAGRIARAFGYAWADVDETPGYRAVIRLHRRGAEGVREAWQ